MTGIFRNRWWVVFATICGLVVGAGPINVFTFGVFLKPITEDLGLSRGAFSAALTFHAAIAAIVLPIIGWLVDRWGARRIVHLGLSRRRAARPPLCRSLRTNRHQCEGRRQGGARQPGSRARDQGA